MSATRRNFKKRVLELLSTRPGYVWGGKTDGGLDCSGFCTLAYKYAGGADLRAEFNTDRMWAELKRQPSAPSEHLEGDLVIYGNREKNDPSHVMVYLGDDLVVGMAWGGKTDTNAAASKFDGKVALVRELNYRDDLMGFVTFQFEGES